MPNLEKAGTSIIFINSSRNKNSETRLREHKHKNFSTIIIIIIIIIITNLFFINEYTLTLIITIHAIASYDFLSLQMGATCVKRKHLEMSTTF